MEKEKITIIENDQFAKLVGLELVKVELGYRKSTSMGLGLFRAVPSLPWLILPLRRQPTLAEK